MQLRALMNPQCPWGRISAPYTSGVTRAALGLGQLERLPGVKMPYMESAAIRHAILKFQIRESTTESFFFVHVVLRVRVQFLPDPFLHWSRLLLQRSFADDLFSG